MSAAIGQKINKTDKHIQELCIHTGIDIAEINLNKKLTFVLY